MRRRLSFRTVWPLIAIIAVVFPIGSDGRPAQAVPEDLEKLGDLLPQPAPVLGKDPSAYGFRGSPRGDVIAFFRKLTADAPGAERAARGEYALLVSDSTGEHARAMSEAVLDEFAPAPAWSPDGTSLAHVYAQRVARGDDDKEWYWAARLAVADRDAKSNRVTFRQVEGLFRSVAWSPYGRVLAVGFILAGIDSRAKSPELHFLARPRRRAFPPAAGLPIHTLLRLGFGRAATSPRPICQHQPRRFLTPATEPGGKR